MTLALTEVQALVPGSEIIYFDASAKYLIFCPMTAISRSQVNDLRIALEKAEIKAILVIGFNPPRIYKVSE